MPSSEPDTSLTTSPVPTLPDSGTPHDAPTADVLGAGEPLTEAEQALKDRAEKLGWNPPQNGVYRTHPTSNGLWADGTQKRTAWSLKQAEHATQDDALQTAILASQGNPIRSIAKRLRIKEAIIRDILANPDVQGYIKTLRDASKQIAAEGAFSAQRHAWKWLKDVAKKKEDPKALQSVANGLASIERISASVAGESRPQTNIQTAVVTGDVAAELKDLLSKLSGKD